MKKKRCEWCLGHDIYEHYHDEHWGVPRYDDETLFEFLTLEGAQAGLNWLTVLKKQEGYRKAFAGWDVQKVARFSEKKILKTLENPNIIRNKLKVRSTVSNAQAFIKIQNEYGSFSKYFWGFANGKPIINRFKTMKQVPATTPLSDQISKQFKKDGFRFVGSTIIYAYMQSMGMVNDHVTSCFRYRELNPLSK